MEGWRLWVVACDLANNQGIKIPAKGWLWNIVFFISKARLNSICASKENVDNSYWIKCSLTQVFTESSEFNGINFIWLKYDSLEVLALATLEAFLVNFKKLYGYCGGDCMVNNIHNKHSTLVILAHRVVCGNNKIWWSMIHCVPLMSNTYLTLDLQRKTLWLPSLLESIKWITN